ncbi:MAG: hypothetical protein VX367_00195 [SAR324 cluster bacterium]|nr:hypothetical protein [SAR324 cluster bacterium]
MVVNIIFLFTATPDDDGVIIVFTGNAVVIIAVVITGLAVGFEDFSGFAVAINEADVVVNDDVIVVCDLVVDDIVVIDDEVVVAVVDDVVFAVAVVVAADDIVVAVVLVKVYVSLLPYLKSIPLPRANSTPMSFRDDLLRFKL